MIHTTFSELDRAFIERCSMFFLATADAAGRPDCSYKAGPPGFVRIVDERTLAFPDYDGNGMFRSLGNILVNPHVGLLFVDFERPGRRRVNGWATLSDNDPLLLEYPGAQLVVRVEAREIFRNCSHSVHRMQLLEPAAAFGSPSSTPTRPPC